MIRADILYPPAEVMEFRSLATEGVHQVALHCWTTVECAPLGCRHHCCQIILSVGRISAPRELARCRSCWRWAGLLQVVVAVIVASVRERLVLQPIPSTDDSAWTWKVYDSRVYITKCWELGLVRAVAGTRVESWRWSVALPRYGAAISHNAASALATETCGLTLASNFEWRAAHRNVGKGAAGCAVAAWRFGGEHLAEAVQITIHASGARVPGRAISATLSVVPRLDLCTSFPKQCS
eukprot:SAG31_NODE_2926_length_4901_cov_2.229696_2_plen_238_part_00